MAFGTPTSIGSGNNGIAGTSVTMASLATVNVGDVIALIYAGDNLGSADGDNSDVTSVTDVVGNTYVKVIEWTNSNGAAAAGGTVSLWICNVTVQLVLTTGIITVNLAGSVTSKGVTAITCTKTAANTLAVTGTPQTDTGDNADPANMTISGLPSAEYLFLNGIAMEQATAVVYTPGTNYTAFTKDGTGVAQTAITVCGGFRVLTGTGDSYDASTSIDRDYVQVYAAIAEVAAAGEIAARFVIFTPGVMIFSPGQATIEI